MTRKKKKPPSLSCTFRIDTYWHFRLPQPATKKLCDFQTYQEIEDFILVRTVARYKYKSDNTRCHATPKTTVVVVVVAAAAAAAIPYRIIPLSQPTSTQNLSSITVKILNMPNQTKTTHTATGSERWEGGKDRIDLFPMRGSLTPEFLPSSD